MKKHLSLPATHLSLGILRVVYHSAVLWLLADLWSWRASAFAAHRDVAAVLIPLGLAINLLLVLGLLTRPLLVANVVLLRTLFWFCQDPYTVDDVVQCFSLVLAFSPAPRAFSLDSALKGTREPRAPLPPAFVLLVYVALVLLYEDSVYCKLQSEIWRSGAAFWLGAALPFTAWHPLPAWLEVAWLMKTATYVALAYEGLFPLIVVPALRGPLLALGFTLHLGSGFFFPLPQFALVMLGLLCLFVPFPGRGSLPAPAPAGRPRTRGEHLCYALATAMLVSQVWLHFEQDRNVLSWLTGTQRWLIFVDSHFTLPGPLYRFAAMTPEGESPIPSFDEQARPTTRDRYWKCLGFSMRAGGAEEKASRYLIAWFQQQGRPPGPVRVYCKDVHLRTLTLDFALDDEIRARPWITCGVVSFQR